MAAVARFGDAEEPSLVWVAVRYRAALVAVALVAGSLLPAYDTSTPLLYPPAGPRYGNGLRCLGLTHPPNTCAFPTPRFFFVQVGDLNGARVLAVGKVSGSGRARSRGGSRRCSTGAMPRTQNPEP